MNFKVKLVALDGSIIDEILVKNINYHPNQEKELYEVTGTYGRVKLDMILRYVSK